MGKSPRAVVANIGRTPAQKLTVRQTSRSIALARSAAPVAPTTGISRVLTSPGTGGFANMHTGIATAAVMLRLVSPMIFEVNVGSDETKTPGPIVQYG